MTMISSQTSSAIDTISRRTGHRSTNPSSLSRGRTGGPLPNQEDVDIVLETFINSLQLNTFFGLPEDQQEERLAKIDALELFHAVQDVNRDLAMARLENHYLTDFLEKNDPKLLIGLQQRRATAQNQIFTQQLRAKDGTQSMSSSFGTKTRASMSRSHVTTTMSTNTGGSQKKTASDYKLNFRAKTDMAEKTANEVEKRVHEIEKTASREIKTLRGRMEEMRFMLEETQETVKNFKLHFLRDNRDLDFLNNATEKQLDRKIRKFVNNWIKNARALLATMRLKITSLQEHCQQLSNELLTKADLSGILTAIDFEKLMIKRTELLNSLDEKNIHMTGLKGVTGKASLSMSEEKQIMMNIEEESKQLNNKTVDVIKAIGKLEKEAQIVEVENEKDIETMQSLRMQLDRLEAPSVNQYIDKKDELSTLDKEEKILKRKIYILNMKLDNTQKKCRRKHEELMIINA